MHDGITEEMRAACMTACLRQRHEAAFFLFRWCKMAAMTAPSFSVASGATLCGGAGGGACGAAGGGRGHLHPGPATRDGIVTSHKVNRGLLTPLFISFHNQGTARYSFTRD